jgi:hypothetical protein
MIFDQTHFEPEKQVDPLFIFASASLWSDFFFFFAKICLETGKTTKQYVEKATPRRTYRQPLDKPLSGCGRGYG